MRKKKCGWKKRYFNIIEKFNIAIKKNKKFKEITQKKTKKRIYIITKNFRID
jgi:hypothetical protein